MRQLRIGNYVIKASVMEVLQRLRIALTNGKLRDIKDGTENIVVTCPAHGGGQESHPACNIYVGPDSKIEYGFFNCFVCGTKGSFLKFVAHCFDSSENYAQNWLLKNFEGELVAAALSMGDDIIVGGVKKHLTVLDESVLYDYLTWHPYLGQRKLSREICSLFNVRYDPKYRQVIFPAYDIRGRLLMTPKRAIDTKSFYLDKDTEKPVYCLNYIQEKGYTSAVITEGPFDCLTGWQYGYPTCATFGQLSDFQVDQLNQSNIKVLYTAFDNDEAGRKFTRMLKFKLSDRIIVKEVELPQGKKDINDLSKEEFDACMQKALNSSIETSYNIKNKATLLRDKIKKYNLKKENF
jgi:DNA primase